MGSLLKIALILFGLWLILRLVKRAMAGRRSAPPASPPPADMLRCDYCGVYVPRTEAITAHPKAYCTHEHAAADRSKN